MNAPTQQTRLTPTYQGRPQRRSILRFRPIARTDSRAAASTRGIGSAADGAAAFGFTWAGGDRGIVAEPHHALLSIKLGAARILRGPHRRKYPCRLGAAMARSAGGRGPRTPYSDVASVYDRVYAWKDYGHEADRVRSLIRRYCARPPRTLLDVACGTGSHLVHLSRSFDSTGVDLSEEMLAVARKRLPQVRFHRAPMQEFRLGETFDALTCLFSAIGYVRSEAELRRTLRTFSRHLREGGVAIVEPWLTPGTFRSGEVRVSVQRSRAGPLVRMNSAEMRGGRSILTMHYLVGEGGVVRHWSEVHNMGLFSRATMEAAFRAAGLRARYLRRGLMPGRGLYVARKVAAESSTRPRRPRATRGR